MARETFPYTCGYCGTDHHIEYGSVLPTECPACTDGESWDAVVLYRAIRPKKRKPSPSDDGEQVIDGEQKHKWKQLLPQFKNINSWSKLDGFDLYDYRVE